jgi:pre-mRNA-processing factor 6
LVGGSEITRKQPSIFKLESHFTGHNQNNDDAKVILANSVQYVDHSVKIWLAAADLESDIPSKKRVLRKGGFSVYFLFPSSKFLLFFPAALEHIPNSVRLWKEAVNLEDSHTDARILLARAVELIPLAIDLWLALARVETPERAKAVLNKAHKAVPTSHEIWIAAGRLMEQEAISPAKTPEQRDKELTMLDKTIEHAVGELRRNQVMLTREQWLKQAEDCEAQGSPRTCEAIVKATVAMDIDEEDRIGTWIGDAEAAQNKGRFGTARAVWAYALKVFPDRKNLWQEAAALEKAHGTKSVIVFRNGVIVLLIVHALQGVPGSRSSTSRPTLPTS